MCKSSRWASTYEQVLFPRYRRETRMVGRNHWKPNSTLLLIGDFPFPNQIYFNAEMKKMF